MFLLDLHVGWDRIFDCLRTPDIVQFLTCSKQTQLLAPDVKECDITTQKSLVCLKQFINLECVQILFNQDAEVLLHNNGVQNMVLEFAAGVKQHAMIFCSVLERLHVLAQQDASIAPRVFLNTPLLHTLSIENIDTWQDIAQKATLEVLALKIATFNLESNCLPRLYFLSFVNVKMRHAFSHDFVTSLEYDCSNCQSLFALNLPNLLVLRLTLPVVTLFGY
jgi:hypothetical protein